MNSYLYLKFFNPPSALLASGSKSGVELGGSKNIISIDQEHNFYNVGTIYTEMSWAEFYRDIEGLEDQIDTFTTREYKSIQDDPDALVESLVDNIRNIINEKRLFYGIGDFEVDAFMNENTIIPGLELENELINTLMDAHKKSRNRDQFPTLLKTQENKKYINITIQGQNKDKLQIPGGSLEDIADKLRFAKGFATGLVVSSKKSANLFMMNDRIVFQEDRIPEFYIDQDCITIIESGIERDKLFPISWFRFDIGIRSLETLESWDKIKENEKLKKVLKDYDNYITKLIVEKYISLTSPMNLTSDFEKEFLELNPSQKKKSLRDMAEAIRILTEEYEE
ncbi:MAG: hypothetical protein BAJALOKI3v1_330024 [Promethearchaeota archaeon]|jgi:hypothetical protein|nr:MAG: hypothetical protein BAJALOKI3v1_330024 [Candidatus Lokiarchaeota archaeon]